VRADAIDRQRYHALAAGTAHAADTVQVGIRVLRHVEDRHELHALDLRPARNNLHAHQHMQLVLAKRASASFRSRCPREHDHVERRLYGTCRVLREPLGANSGGRIPAAAKAAQHADAGEHAVTVDATKSVTDVR
jgi:hypothetical protein